MSLWQEKLHLFTARPFENENGCDSRWLAARLATSPVLEVGCASALDYALFKYLDKKYTGIDITPAFVEQAKLRGADVKLGSVLQLPYRDAEFSTVYCRHVLEHLHRSELSRAISEMCRVARELVICTFFLPPADDEILQVDEYGFHANRYARKDILAEFKGRGAVTEMRCANDRSVLYVVDRRLRPVLN